MVKRIDLRDLVKAFMDYMIPDFEDKFQDNFLK